MVLRGEMMIFLIAAGSVLTICVYPGRIVRLPSTAAWLARRSVRGPQEFAGCRVQHSYPGGKPNPLTWHRPGLPWSARMLSSRRAGHARARQELRQLAGRPRDAQDQDDLPDSAAAPDQLPPDNTKRAKWRRTARKVADVVLGVLELIGNFLP